MDPGFTFRMNTVITLVTAKKKTTAAKAGKKPKKASNAKSKGHELSIRKGRR
jgi:hypothetical protein